jgi:hypothetical protein
MMRNRRRGGGFRREDKGDIDSAWTHDLFVADADNQDTEMKENNTDDAVMFVDTQPSTEADDIKITISNNPSTVVSNRPHGTGKLLGYKVQFSDLHYEVGEDDLKGLLVATIQRDDANGTVLAEQKWKSISILYDAAGRSEGLANVMFEDEETARSAAQQCNGREIGGQRIRVEFLGPVNLNMKRSGGARFDRRGSRRPSHYHRQQQPQPQRGVVKSGGVMARLGGREGGGVMSRLNFGGDRRDGGRDRDEHRRRSSGPYDRPRGGRPSHRREESLRY